MARPVILRRRRAAVVHPVGGAGGVYYAGTYCAGTYFTAYYFPGVPVAPSNGGVYFCPNYFAFNYFTPYYFPSGYHVVVIADLPPDERDVFAAIEAALTALTTTDGTPIFDAVQYVETPDSVEASQDWAAYSVVWKISGGYIDDAMSEIPDVMVTVSYGILMQVNGLESRDRADALTRVVALIMRRLNDVSIAGMTLPGLTRLRQERRAAGQQAQGSVTLTGEFAILTNDDDFDVAFQD
jgi:hypothetical protein